MASAFIAAAKNGSSTGWSKAGLRRAQEASTPEDPLVSTPRSVTPQQKHTASSLLPESQLTLTPTTRVASFQHGWGLLPNGQTAVLEGELEKQTMNKQWKRRYAVLTSQKLFFSRQDRESVVDMIALGDIESISSVDTEEAFRREQPVAGSRKETQGPRQSSATSDHGQSPSGINADLFRLEAEGGIVENQSEVKQEEHRQYFEVRTVVGSFNNGRTYTLKATTREEHDEWVKVIGDTIAAAKKEVERERYRTWPQRVQLKVRKAFNTDSTQLATALLIVANFCINVIEFELLPEEGTARARLFNALDVVFNYLFLVELVFNMAAHWFYDFFTNGWSLFDFVVVVVSTTSMFVPTMPGVSLLRLIRVVRVLKLFKQLQSLKIILQSMVSAILPVANAFVVLVLFASLYSVMAVMFFREMGQGLSGEDGLFDRFSTALFTMFQITTGDGWVTDIVRPMNNGDLMHDFPINLFFVSYFLVANVVMLNIVVAVLLDEFVNTTTEFKEQQANSLMSTRREFHVLDPLLERLVHFTTEADLAAQIKALFRMLDNDDNGGVGYSELQEGLRKLSSEHSAPMQLSPDEFAAITTSPAGRFCDQDGEIPLAQFDQLIRYQLVLYVQRQLALGSNHEGTRSTTFSCTQAMLQGLQVLVLSQQQRLQAIEDNLPGAAANLNYTQTPAFAAGTAPHASDRQFQPLDAQFEAPDRQFRDMTPEQMHEMSRRILSMESKMDALLNCFNISPPVAAPGADSARAMWSNASGGSVTGMSTSIGDTHGLRPGGKEETCVSTAAESWHLHTSEVVETAHRADKSRRQRMLEKRYLEARAHAAHADVAGREREIEWQARRAAESILTCPTADTDVTGVPSAVTPPTTTTPRLSPRQGFSLASRLADVAVSVGQVLGDAAQNFDKNSAALVPFAAPRSLSADGHGRKRGSSRGMQMRMGQGEHVGTSKRDGVGASRSDARQSESASTPVTPGAMTEQVQAHRGRTTQRGGALGDYLARRNSSR